MKILDKFFGKVDCRVTLISDKQSEKVTVLVDDIRSVTLGLECFVKMEKLFLDLGYKVERKENQIIILKRECRK